MTALPCPVMTLLNTRSDGSPRSEWLGIDSSYSKSDYFRQCAGAGAVFGLYGGAAVGGAPFYALEELFWDLPRKALASHKPRSAPAMRTGTIENGRVIWDDDVPAAVR